MNLNAKKGIIFAISVLLLAAIGFGINIFVTDYIAASGPTDDAKPLVMINDSLYQSESSCAQNAFDAIVNSKGFALSETKINKTIKSDQTPTVNQSTNFKLFQDKEIYLSQTAPNEMYIKTEVNGETRFFLFTPANSATGT